MSNRISNAFADERGNPKKALVAFLTGGDPDIATTERLIPAMAAAGADVIEIGIPFSDPIAEGIVIQSADERALAAGCTADALFEMVARLRGSVAVPLLFMTYVNPVFTYGKQRFMRRCAECGIDGVIAPDVPFEEKAELAADCAASGITLISMIAPTSAGRVATIAREAEGFLYCVSSLGVTGMRSEISSDVAALIRAAKQVTAIPCAVGFGISTPGQARDMAAISDGVIVGSAIVNIIARHGRDSVEPVSRFIGELKSAMLEARGLEAR